MVSISMLNNANATLAVSSRPAILTYTSALISTSLTVLNSPLLIAGFKRESETLLIPIMERFEFSASRGARPRWANVEVAADGGRIQVYSTKLIFVAQFEGVRYTCAFSFDSRWFMYSHRIIAFALFTSLFFISSSLFAGLTWFLFSLRSSTASPHPDDHHDGASNHPAEEKEDVSRTELADEDTLTMSNPPTPRLDFLRLSSTNPISRTYPPAEPLAGEEYHQSYKSGFPSESVASASSRGDNSRSSITQFKTDDESMSGDTQDDSVETIARGSISEISF